LSQAQFLIAFRIRDPETRSVIRQRIADEMGADRVTDTIWEIAPETDPDDPELIDEWWSEQLEWLEETIDPRSDVIHISTAKEGVLLHSTIGGGG
jgi:hypothetical protein